MFSRSTLKVTRQHSVTRTKPYLCCDDRIRTHSISQAFVPLYEVEAFLPPHYVECRVRKADSSKNDQRKQRSLPYALASVKGMIDTSTALSQEVKRDSVDDRLSDEQRVQHIESGRPTSCPPFPCMDDMRTLFSRQLTVRSVKCW